MPLHCAAPDAPKRFASAPLTRCAACGDWMVAPLMSEFDAAGEIRHHWVCESCGEVSCTTVVLAAAESE
ncbi:MAG: hypothetical protein IRY89_11345 [Pseudolabrys sp.]|nr:hypothetical protein [Pseudolabrys sp.]